ncbi:cAMP-binding proteins - catabolite gene activator and regulatory subunit of cAMP-dependent protein kinases [Vibrio chagasii]|nr:cAMP-binding proteins - catabolite gene activator and regulatory subunit of cAMP-dependent protein kinases [Vibrio chagasii]
MKLVEQNCLHCKYARNCIPKGLPIENVANYLSVPIRQALSSKGVTLFSEREKANSFYRVIHGSLKLSSTNIEGDEHIYGLPMSGDIVALDAYSEEEFHYTASAMTPTVVCKIPYKHLEFAMGEDASIQTNFYKLMSSSINEAREQKNGLSGQKKACKKQLLVGFLLKSSLKLTPKGKGQFLLPMKFSDVASYLGLTSEHISRTLAKLVTAGYITKSGKLIEIINREKLEYLYLKGFNE